MTTLLTKRYKSSCLFAAFILLFSFLHTNAQQLLFKNFKVKDGLPSTEVYCVFQDSKGFIWFGSDGGVSKFDGYSFKNYTTEDGLADNVVFGILEDKRGRIWFRSLSGKLCYVKNDSIYKIEANEAISTYMKNAIMTSFYVDSKDTVWCGLRTGCGYFKIAPPYNNKNFQAIPTGEEPYLIEIETGHFIIGSMFFYKGNVLNLISVYKKQALQNKIQITGLDYTHILYSWLCKDTFLMADGERAYLVQQNKSSVLLTKQQVFNAEPLFIKESGNYTWLGMLGKGVLKCPKNNNLHWDKAQQLLNGISVSDVMLDKEGGTWFTTLNDGVCYSPPAHFVSYQNTTGFNYRQYNIEKLGEDHVLISIKPNLVDIISADTIIKNIRVNDKKFIHLLDSFNIPSMLITAGNTLKGDSFNVYLWKKEKHHLQELKKPNNSRYIIDFYAKGKSTKKDYVFQRQLLLFFDTANKYIKTIQTLPSRTLSIYQDKKGIIWLGCLNGLWSFDEKKFTYHGNENELLKNPIEDIKKGPNGTMYYATRGKGIIICENGNYTKVTTTNGLNSNNCKCLYIDDDKTVWVGSKSGICKLKKDADGWHGYKIDLPNNEINYEIFKIEKTENTLWLFTNHGLLSYQLTTGATELPPDIYLNGFSVNEISHINDSLLVFKYNQNSLKISFIGLSFQSLGKLSYRYKLDGLDTAWHTTQSTALQYPFLPPGNYKFYVKAISFGGTESKDVASISFTINKPFWKTAWFIAIAILLIIACICFLFYYQLKKIKKKEAERTFFNQQLSGLEMKALRSQMNPHFIFNAINSIQNYIVKNDSRTAQDYLAKFARLIRNVLENSKQENISLHNEVETLKLYIELEQLRTPTKFTCRVIIQDNLELNNITIPPLILQPYVENAILHGLMPLTVRPGQLTIILETKENKLICIIEDNGVGRRKAAELKQKKQFIHRSIGLSVTEDRIKLMNDLHKSESSIRIEDKISAEGDAEGTRVVILINLSK